MSDLLGETIAYFGFTGVIDSHGVTRIAVALNEATNSGCEVIYLCMSSMGGYVADGIYLYNHIRALPPKIVIHNTGSISSIAVAVFVASEERYCSPYGTFMIHPTTIGPFNEGLAWQRLDSCLKAALAEEERTEGILREWTGLPARHYLGRPTCQRRTH